MVHALGGAFQQIGEADQDEAVPQADGVVDVGEGIEANPESGHLGAGPKLAVGVLKKLVEYVAH